MKKTERAKQWKGMIKEWSKYKPPMRPSPQDIFIIETFLKKEWGNLSTKRALILGCTVEFRNMLARNKVPTTIFDANEEMIEATTSEVRETGCEEVVRGDWLQTSLNNKFDMILSDYAINQLPEKQWPAIFTKVNNLLKPDGIFIHHSYWDIHKNAPSKKEWINRFLERKRSLKEMTNFWWGVLFYYCYDERTKEIYNERRQQFWEEVLKGKKKDSPEHAFFEAETKFLAIFKKTWTVLPEKEEKELIEKYFTVNREEHANDYSWAFHCPIYFLKKR